MCHPMLSKSESYICLFDQCKRYLNGEVVGDLCSPICQLKTVNSYSCNAFHAGKEAVFTATYNDKQKIVIKSSTQEEPHDIFYWLDHSTEGYPSEEEFVRMIQHRVNSRFVHKQDCSFLFDWVHLEVFK